VGKVHLIGAPCQSNIGRHLNIMAITAQQPDENGIDAVVVDVKPYRPSLTRSSVDSGRGFPLYL